MTLGSIDRVGVGERVAVRVRGVVGESKCVGYGEK